jgi:hypothetical protein
MVAGLDTRECGIDALELVVGKRRFIIGKSSRSSTRMWRSSRSSSSRRTDGLGSTLASTSWARRANARSPAGRTPCAGVGWQQQLLLSSEVTSTLSFEGIEKGSPSVGRRLVPGPLEQQRREQPWWCSWTAPAPYPARHYP